MNIIFISDEECANPSPDLPHATKLVNSTHVTYICESGYYFRSDSKETRTYSCDCVHMAALEGCSGKPSTQTDSAVLFTIHICVPHTYVFSLFMLYMI